MKEDLIFIRLTMLVSEEQQARRIIRFIKNYNGFIFSEYNQDKKLLQYFRK